MTGKERSTRWLQTSQIKYSQWKFYENHEYHKLASAIITPTPDLPILNSLEAI